MAESNGKTALVTGSTDGVGRVVAKRLGEAGWRLLVHGRDRGRGERIVAEIKDAGGSAELLIADLSSLADVRRLAEAVQKTTERLDLLINNAGVGTGGSQAMRQTSTDGYELRFAVNYLAGFLLTQLLLPLMKKSGPARIVNVSSLGQEAIDFDDVMLAERYSGLRAYRQSKLAQIIHDRSRARAQGHRRDGQCSASGDIHEHDHGPPIRRHADQQRRGRRRRNPQACGVARRRGAKRTLFQRTTRGPRQRAGL
jgi:NAD(P)-dependent dehydrogenase (short-subunit alcohol dehydrogenase family)